MLHSALARTPPEDWRAYTLRRPRKLKRIEADLRLVCSSWRAFVERSILVDLEESDVSTSGTRIRGLSGPDLPSRFTPLKGSTVSSQQSTQSALLAKLGSQ